MIFEKDVCKIGSLSVILSNKNDVLCGKKSYYFSFHLKQLHKCLSWCKYILCIIQKCCGILPIFVTRNILKRSIFKGTALIKSIIFIFLSRTLSETAPFISYYFVIIFHVSVWWNTVGATALIFVKKSAIQPIISFAPSV